MVKDLHVCVAVPSNGYWVAATARSVALLFSYFASHPIAGYRSQRMSLIGAEGSQIHVAREKMTRAALRAGATHLLFIDSDMKVPMEVAHGLIRHNKDCVAANCTNRKEPITALARDFEGNVISSNEKTGLEKVRSVGTAVMLIKTDVIKRLTPPLFMSEWIPTEQDFCGEDIYFTQKLQEIGVDIWVDHDLSKVVGHVGQREYGHWDLEDWKGPTNG